MRRALVAGLWLLVAGRVRAASDDSRLDLFVNAMEEIRQRYVDEHKAQSGTLLTDALDGVIDSLDPESLVVAPGDEPAAGAADIGVTLGVRDGLAEVLDVVENSPAALAGLEPGSRLIRVNAEGVVGKKRLVVDRALRGPAGSTVSVLWQAPDAESHETAMKREVVARPAWRRIPLLPDVDVIQVFRFDAGSVKDILAALAAAKNDDAPGVVFDLRHAAGGDPEAALALADAFVPPATVLAYGEGPGAARAKTYTSPGRAPRIPGPVVALVGEGTMGAAELFAGSLRDRHKLATVGRASFGFCARQRDFPLAGSGGKVLRLTVERFSTASHVSLTVTPVGADIELAIEATSRTGKLFLRHHLVDRLVDRLTTAPPAAFDPEALKAGELKLASPIIKGKSVTEQAHEFEQEFEIALEALVRDLELDVPPDEVDQERPLVLRAVRAALARRLMKPDAALAAALRLDPTVARGADTLRAIRKFGRPLGLKG